MQSDEPTIPEGLEEALVRAGFGYGDDVAALIEQNLRADHARHRVLALRAGAHQSLLAPEAWLTALGDPDVEVRREALTLLAYEEIDDERVFSGIVDELGDDDALVVDAAAFASGEHLRVDAVEQLIVVATSHDDARCREAAIAALGAIGDDRGRGTVLAALEDKPPVRRRAIVALSNFEGPDIDSALERAAQDRDWQVRAAVDQLTRDED
ncbi:MAG: HEAT repeat domain-containing protein [Acidimicrobiales bacterium]